MDSLHHTHMRERLRDLRRCSSSSWATEKRGWAIFNTHAMRWVSACGIGKTALESETNEVITFKSSQLSDKQRSMEMSETFCWPLSQQITQAALKLWHRGKLTGLYTGNELGRAGDFDNLIKWSISLHCQMKDIFAIKDWVSYYM